MDSNQSSVLRFSHENGSNETKHFYSSHLYANVDGCGFSIAHGDMLRQCARFNSCCERERKDATKTKEKEEKNKNACKKLEEIEIRMWNCGLATICAKIIQKCWHIMAI